MSWLEMPSLEQWEERQQWFEELGDSIQGQGSHFVSDHACALIGEVQTCFCAGAWIAVIVLAVSVMDAQLREFSITERTANTKELFDTVGVDPKLQNLRIRRNKIIHINPDNPELNVDQLWDNQKELEAEAREAIKLMFEIFYNDPGT